MLLKLSFLFTSVFFLVACSPSNSNEITIHDESLASISEVSDSKAYSTEKQKYIQSCIETSDEKFCSCQFDLMDPILSSSVGSDWNTKNMEEKDFETYLAAIESAVSQCS